jgi:hypothetical protein
MFVNVFCFLRGSCPPTALLLLLLARILSNMIKKLLTFFVKGVLPPDGAPSKLFYLFCFIFCFLSFVFYFCLFIFCCFCFFFGCCFFGCCFFCCCFCYSWISGTTSPTSSPTKICTTSTHILR